jgi:hypothetical protein
MGKKKNPHAVALGRNGGLKGGLVRARSLACVVMWACISGCALMYQGHNIDENVIKSIQPGITTEEVLVRLLGPPETIIKKNLEGITVYQYKYVRILSIGIPFFVSIGRITQNGRVLNIMVKSGKVMDYEDNQMQEQFFWKSKAE